MENCAKAAFNRFLTKQILRDHSERSNLYRNTNFVRKNTKKNKQHEGKGEYCWLWRQRNNWRTTKCILTLIYCWLLFIYFLWPGKIELFHIFLQYIDIHENRYWVEWDIDENSLQPERLFGYTHGGEEFQALLMLFASSFSPTDRQIRCWSFSCHILIR